MYTKITYIIVIVLASIVSSYKTLPFLRFQRSFVNTKLTPYQKAVTKLFEARKDFHLGKPKKNGKIVRETVDGEVFYATEFDLSMDYDDEDMHTEHRKFKNDHEWMFFDVAKINVKGGDGGDGCSALRREFRVQHGGPSGGNGGHGGHVLLECDKNLNTLSLLHRMVHYKGRDGTRGRGDSRHGQNGAHCIAKVPPGTIVRTEEGILAGELNHHGERFVVARGGKGGKGNEYFKTARDSTPCLAENGEPGTARWLNIELKLVADVGFIGVPNAGKSTLLAAVSNAKPKIADYPFTTIVPNLGVCNIFDTPSGANPILTTTTVTTASAHAIDEEDDTADIDEDEEILSTTNTMIEDEDEVEEEEEEELLVADDEYTHSEDALGQQEEEQEEATIEEDEESSEALEEEEAIAESIVIKADEKSPRKKKQKQKQKDMFQEEDTRPVLSPVRDAIVIADIPGLLEGAHAGVGLGIAFLRHIQRCRVLVHIISGDSEDPIGDFHAINQELELFNPTVAKKMQVVVINKIDLPHVREKAPGLITKLQQCAGHKRILAISAAARENTKELMFRIQRLLSTFPVQSSDELFSEEEERVNLGAADGEELAMSTKRHPFEVMTDPDFPGQYRVIGLQIERIVKMTNWEYYGATERFQRILEAQGILDALDSAGAKQGNLIMIGDYDFEYWEKRNQWLSELGSD